MADSLLYALTAKGRAEIAAKPGTLSPSFKTLLGLVGNKSGFGEIKGRLPQVPEDKLRPALEKLVAEGYVETMSQPSTADNDLDFTRYFNRPVKEPTLQQRKQAEQQTMAGMRTLKQAGYYVNILNRPGKRIAPRYANKYCVLIIDADQADALVLARTLLLAKFEVRSAAARDEIIAELNRQPLPDAIVMDVVLPELNGLDLLSRVRQHPSLQTVPVIIMTAKVEQESVVAALARGASGYMTKPFKPEALLESVRAVLGVG